MATPGVVFTKTWVVDFVLDIAGYVPEENLVDGCIVEPSCGDGAFLRRIADRLCRSAKCQDALSVDRLDGCVRAYELDGESVRVSKKAVQEVLQGHGFNTREAECLANTWIIQADFLLSTVPSARWAVGNPPYVRSSRIPKEQRERYSRELSSMTMGSDLYVGFFQKSLVALEDDGVLCFICADRWLQNRYGSRLRAFVSQRCSLDVHVRMHGVKAFEDEVSAYPAISLIGQGRGRKVRYVDCHPEFGPGDVPAALSWIRSAKNPDALTNATAGVLSPLDGNATLPLASPKRLELLDMLSQRCPTLTDAGVRLGIGVASGCDEVYLTQDADLVEPDRLLPLFYMRDWRQGRRDTVRYLVNPWKDDGSLVDLGDYPRLRSYFLGHEERLRKRRVARDYPDAWYRTLDKPNRVLVGQRMLLFPDMSAKSDPVYSDGTKYPHHNCYWMTSSEWDIMALGGLMMSDIVESYVDAFCAKMRGSTLRFQAQYLRKVHIPQACEVSADIMRELSVAFVNGDRERANAASRKAYGLGEDRA